MTPVNFWSFSWNNITIKYVSKRNNYIVSPTAKKVHIGIRKSMFYYITFYNRYNYTIPVPESFYAWALSTSRTVRNLHKNRITHGRAVLSDPGWLIPVIASVGSILSDPGRVTFLDCFFLGVYLWSAFSKIHLQQRNQKPPSCSDTPTGNEKLKRYETKELKHRILCKIDMIRVPFLSWLAHGSLQ